MLTSWKREFNNYLCHFLGFITQIKAKVYLLEEPGEAIPLSKHKISCSDQNFALTVNFFQNYIIIWRHPNMNYEVKN